MGKKHREKLAKKLEKGFGTAEQCVAAHGPDALCELQLLSQAPDVIPHHEVQNLLLWCLHPELGSMPRWVMVRNRPLLRGALVLYVPGLDAAGLRSLHLDGGVQRLVRTPKSTPSRVAQAWAADLLRVKTGRKRKAPGDDALEPSGLHAHQDPTGAWLASYVDQFALTEEELRLNGYPALAGGGPAGAAGSVPPAAADQPPAAHTTAAEAAPGVTCGAATAGGAHGAAAAVGATGGRWCDVASPPRPPARLLSIDCEMCLAGETKQLARVAVVDEAGTTLLDELIVPELPVTDHLTRFSGITPALLATATTTAGAVRIRLLSLIREQPLTYLVGHSLENDLEALGLTHDKVLDTALLFPLRYNLDGRPAKNSLRALTARFLRREIQQSAEGHDPCEDAAAAMELALLKLQRGVQFGLPGDANADFDGLFGTLGRAGWRCSAFDSVAEALQLLDSASEAVHVTAACDASALRLVEAEMQQPRRFAWLPLREVAAAQGCHTTHSEALASLRTRLGQLHARLPPNTLITLVGCGRAAAGFGCVALTVSGRAVGAGGAAGGHTGASAATPAPTPLHGGAAGLPSFGSAAPISGRPAGGGFPG
eukprot:scaffold2714_cov123-Isochrysis_galbana.AAC.2